jgi:hypothetical protein
MTYNPLSGEGIFDVAAKLYNNDTALGVSDLLLLNPTVDINSVDLFGTPLSYTSGLTRKKPVIDVPFLEAQNTYRAHKLQSHFDLAIQLYGDFSQIGEIIRNISDINGEIPLGTEFIIPEQKDPQAEYFNDKIVATDVNIIVDPVFRRIDTADTDLRITDTGDFRVIAA